MADLRGETRWSAIADTFGNAFAPEGRYLRIVENSSMTPDSTVEVIVPEAALKKDLWEFSRNIFFLSLLISALNGGLIYLALYRLVVRPVMKMTQQLLAEVSRSLLGHQSLLANFESNAVGASY